ncbi:hypothetical protein QL285_057318 [Trifolium repens]|nr:hypothetical protein QL285_057318 [Trifolium repens]
MKNALNGVDQPPGTFVYSSVVGENKGRLFWWCQYWKLLAEMEEELTPMTELGHDEFLFAIDYAEVDQIALQNLQWMIL